MKPKKNISRSLTEDSKIGNYKITRKLGQGNFGITYLAKERRSGQQVVIKENFPREYAIRNQSNGEIIADGEENVDNFEWSKKNFLNEANILRELNHPNIVKILEVFEANNTVYYVMPHIEGVSMTQTYSQIRAEEVRESDLLALLRPLLSALVHLHSKGITHRDIKPDNILISNNEPILIDFGAARSTKCTHTVTKIGTRGYCPLEQLESKERLEVCPNWDLYALAGTCYWLIMGEDPNYTPIKLVENEKLRAIYSYELLHSLDRAREKTAANRWQSAQEWLDSIEADAMKKAAQERLAEQNIPENQYDSKLPEAAATGDIELLRQLIAVGVNVNLTAYNGCTPLHAAASEGQSACVEVLLKNGANINATNDLGETPLFVAVNKDSISCVKLLLSVPGIEINKANNDGEPPLYRAKKNRFLTIYNLLHSAGASRRLCAEYTLKKLGIYPSEYDNSVLEATKRNNPHLLNQLIEAEANVNAVDNSGNTALYWAAMKNHLDCARTLLKAPNININQENDVKKTPIHKAAKMGYTDVLTLLIDAGANVNVRDGMGRTPLYLAAEMGRTECVYFLLQAPEIDKNLPDFQGITPLRAALKCRCRDCANLLQSNGPFKKFFKFSLAVIMLWLITGYGHGMQWAITWNFPHMLSSYLALPFININKAYVNGDTHLIRAVKENSLDCAKQLLAAGADVNMEDVNGNTPLILAAGDGKADFVELLLANGAKVNITNNDNQTALYRATCFDHIKCMELLIKEGADANIGDNNNKTPIFLATEDNSIKKLSLLIKAKAKTNIKDEDELTPLHWAASFGHTPCLKLLHAAGANINAPDKNGNTPLHLAAWNGKTDCFEYLVANKANINQKANDGHTPLYWRDYRNSGYLNDFDNEFVNIPETAKDQLLDMQEVYFIDPSYLGHTHIPLPEVDSIDLSYLEYTPLQGNHLNVEKPSPTVINDTQIESIYAPIQLNDVGKPTDNSQTTTNLATKGKNTNVMRLSSDRIFNDFSCIPNNNARPDLLNLASLILNNRENIFVIEAHTDSIGAASYNALLSIQQAAAIREWLKANKVPTQNIFIRACADKSPLVSRKYNREKQTANRRVEIHMLKPGSTLPIGCYDNNYNVDLENKISVQIGQGVNIPKTYPSISTPSARFIPRKM